MHRCREVNDFEFQWSSRVEQTRSGGVPTFNTGTVTQVSQGYTVDHLPEIILRVSLLQCNVPIELRTASNAGAAVFTDEFLHYACLGPRD